MATVGQTGDLAIAETVESREIGDVEMERLKDELDDRGYAIAEQVVATEPLQRLLDALLALDLGHGAGGDSSCFQNLSPGDWGPLAAMVSHPVVMEMCEFELGAGFKMIGDAGRLVARPGQPGQGWHSDLPESGWWGKRGRPFPQDNAGLQTIWAVTDFTADNGATRVVPFSHGMRRPPRPGADLDQYAKAVEMPAGSVAFLNTRMWHRRGENVTDSERVGISEPYVAQWLDPVATWHTPMKQSIWDLMPARVQELNLHAIADSRAEEMNRLHK
jgi:Phytanoyl-CoA dioxygenase (PhyH)